MATPPPTEGRRRIRFPGDPPLPPPSGGGAQPPPGSPPPTPPPDDGQQTQPDNPVQNGSAPTGKLGKIERGWKNPSGMPLVGFAAIAWVVGLCCFGWWFTPIAGLLFLVSIGLSFAASLRIWKRYKLKEIDDASALMRLGLAGAVVLANLCSAGASVWFTVASYGHAFNNMPTP